MVRIGRQIQCLPYAGFFKLLVLSEHAMTSCIFSFFRKENTYSFVGNKQAYFLTWRLKFHLSQKKHKKVFLPLHPFLMILNQIFHFGMHPRIPEIRIEILVNEKGGVIKHMKARAIVKVEFTDLWKKWIFLTRCNGVNYFITNCRQHGSEYHYNMV